MRAGRLDRLITIQRKSETPSDSGEPVVTWINLAPARRPASVTPVRGEERFSGEQYAATGQYDFRVHYSSVLADLTPLDRILYPAPADGGEASVATTAIYNILYVSEIGRREVLSIIAYRQADVT